MKTLAAVGAALALFVGGSGVARAGQVSFDFTGVFDAHLTFNNPPDYEFYTPGVSIFAKSVSGTLNGAPISFFDEGFNATPVSTPGFPTDLDFDAYNPDVFILTAGAPLFTDMAGVPLLLTGTYELVGHSNFGAADDVVGAETLVISDISAAPEPELWALLFAGVAGLGAANRLVRARDRRSGVRAGEAQKSAIA